MKCRRNALKFLILMVVSLCASTMAFSESARCRPERILSSDEADRCFVKNRGVLAQLQAIRHSDESDVAKGDKVRELARLHPDDIYLQAIGAALYSDAGQVMNAGEEKKRRAEAAAILAAILENHVALPRYVARLVEFEYLYNSRLAQPLYLFGLRARAEGMQKLGSFAEGIGAGELGYQKLQEGDWNGARNFGQKSLRALERIGGAVTGEFYTLAVALTGEGAKAELLLEEGIKADRHAREHAYWFDEYRTRVQRINAAYAAQNKALALKNSSGLESLQAHVPTLALKAESGVESDVYEDCKQDYPKLASHFLDLAYRSDGLKIHGILALPQNFDPGKKYPTIIWNHGGNRDFGGLTACSFKGLDAKYTSQGYVVLASQYRGVMGSEGHDEFGGLDVRDVLSLEKYARQWPFVDQERLFMIGGSRGGLMTMKALAEGSQVNAAVVLSGVYDMAAEAGHRPDIENNVLAELVKDYWKDRQTALKERSPVLWADRIHTPVLLIHGKKDWRALWEPAERMHTELKKLGRPSKLILYDESGHDLSASQEKVQTEIKAWLDGGYQKP